MQNADWKDAIEVVNLLDIARLTVEASLAREESRDAFIRPDFPETDDENWKCALAYTRARGRQPVLREDRLLIGAILRVPRR